jgi:hypothetical protein
MSLQASSPALIMEEISIKIISDVIKDFNTEELIEYLKKKNLKLEESHFKFYIKKKFLVLPFLIQLKRIFEIMA